MLQDAFSKWLEAKPIERATTAKVVEWLKNEVFSRFGAPDKITSDPGSQFDSAEFKQFCKSLNVEHHLTSVHHHQSNGLVEKANDTIEKMLRTTCKEQADWSKAIPDCVWAYNTRKHHTTGVTPFSLMFEREARTRIDRMFMLDRVELDPELNKAVALINRQAETSRMKRNYDRKVKKAKLGAGQLVLWHDQVQKRGTAKKLNLKWKGPYRVVKVDRPVGCFGKEASTFTASVVPPGTAVRLVGDAEQRDRFGRLLAYVYRQADGLFVNAELLRRGFAQLLTIPPNIAHTDEFAALARQARESAQGLWSACTLLADGRVAPASSGSRAGAG